MFDSEYFEPSNFVMDFLALPFESQVGWLSSLQLGDPQLVDELAMELGEGAMLAQQFEASGWLSPDVVTRIRAIDAFLTARSGPAHSEFWTLDALEHSADWARVRDDARAALFAL